MLPLLALLSARADDPAVDTASEVAAAEAAEQLDALIAVSVTPIIQHPLIEVEPRTDSEAFRKILRDNQGQLIYCFERSLKSDPSMSGRLTIELTLQEGAVVSVETPVNTFTDADIGRCISSKMRSWRYSESLSGTFTFPFTCNMEP